MVRNRLLGFIAFLARMTNMGLMGAVARTCLVGFRTMMARTSNVGLRRFLARMTGLGIKLDVAHMAGLGLKFILAPLLSRPLPPPSSSSLPRTPGEEYGVHVPVFPQHMTWGAPNPLHDATSRTGG